MSHVVGLELEPVFKRFLRASCLFGNEDRCVDVAIWPLRFCNHADDFVDSVLQRSVVMDGEGCASRLEPFVEITVVEGCSSMPSFGDASGDFKVSIELA